MDWKQLRVMMWLVQMRLMFCLLMRLADRMDVYERKVRNEFIDALNTLEENGYEVGGTD